MLICKEKEDNILNLLKILIDKHHLINKISLDVDDHFDEIFTTEDEMWIREANTNPKWPDAIHENLISKTDEDMKSQADGILNIFANGDVKNKKICDFSNNNYIIEASIARGANYATNLNSIKNIKDNSPYDHIFMYDFLDHVEDPISYLIIARECLNKSGIIHIRCHPWCSRHGGHIFKNINKAWLHLFLSEQALLNLNNQKLCPQKVIHPINTYNSWIKDSGLIKIEQEIVLTKQVEPFLTEPKIFKKILEAYKNSTTPEFQQGKELPTYQLSMQFIDFKVKR